MDEVLYTHPITPCIANEHCEICNKTVGLGTLIFPGEIKFTVCVSCNNHPTKIKAWLIQQFNDALQGNSDFEQLPDGRWQRKQERTVTTEK